VKIPDLVIVVVGPADKIKDQLATLGEVEIRPMPDKTRRRHDRPRRKRIASMTTVEPSPLQTTFSPA